MGVKRRLLFALATSGAFQRGVTAWAPLRARAWRSARRHVAGESVADAIAVAHSLGAAGLATSVDLFGERTTRPQAAAVAAAYVDLCAALARSTDDRVWLSVDLSHLAFDRTLLHRVAAAVPPGRRLQVGAEEAAVADRVLDLVVGAARDGRPVEATLQANLRRSPDDARRLAADGVPVRLVKGAYVEAARDAHQWGPATDAAYAALARDLHRAGVDVALATHDAALRDALLAELPGARCELLLGIAERDAVALAAAGVDTRVYVPYGPDWLRYFLRRRAESQGA
jgi:proline dehydrogenase